MSVLAPPPELLDDRALTREVLAHLDAQIVSAQRLLETVLEQGAAIRARDVHTVVRLAGLMHGEMTRRQSIEAERSRLLAQCGARLGIAPETVTLTRLTTLMEPAAAAARAGALGAAARAAGRAAARARLQPCADALELSFLDHLMTSLALDGAHGYDPRGSTAAGPRPRGALHVLDLRA